MTPMLFTSAAFLEVVELNCLTQLPSWKALLLAIELAIVFAVENVWK
jgi:hypothetical protein